MKFRMSTQLGLFPHCVLVASAAPEHVVHSLYPRGRGWKKVPGADGRPLWLRPVPLQDFSRAEVRRVLSEEEH
jgi:hypothetical protein